MGAILRGRDVDLGRELAIKVLLESHRSDSDAVRRFVEEAQIGGQLQHPGIVSVYELGTFPDRRPFFAMKLVKGRTLAAILRERQSHAASPDVGAGSARREDRGTEPPPRGAAGAGLPTPPSARPRSARVSRPRRNARPKVSRQTPTTCHASWQSSSRSARPWPTPTPAG